MQVKILTGFDLSRLESFLVGSSTAIQQHPAWAEVQSSLGSEVIRLGVLNDTGKLIGYTQIFTKKLPLGLTWLHIPRGPILRIKDKGISNKDSELFNILLSEIKRFGQKQGAVFVRFDWPEGNSQFSVPSSQLMKAHSTNFPETTLVLDLTRSEEELLAEMKPKGRYNIRVAERHGIEVREETDLATADIFYDLLVRTTTRDGFTGHPREYYRKFLEVLTQKGLASCFVARKDGRPVAASLVTFFIETATYYYGASDHEFRNLMAPYAVQWAAIRAAKERGFKTYDFLGIAPDETENHSLSGVTDFKKKFGGKVVNYPESSELVLRSALYRILKIYKKLR